MQLIHLYRHICSNLIFMFYFIFLVSVYSNPITITIEWYSNSCIAMWLYLDEILLTCIYVDAPCPDDQNNCPNNSYCYIYSETDRPYCSQSCELNNGGCGIDQCVMVTALCFTAPCPPVVQCRSTSKLMYISLQ